MSAFGPKADINWYSSHFRAGVFTRYDALPWVLGKVMRRRSRKAGASDKPQRRKSATLKRRNASNATRNRGASIAGQETAVARLTRERDEALAAGNCELRDITSYFKLAWRSGIGILHNSGGRHSHL
jgi:hypothetical protein